jgi:thymidylate kinase
MMTTRHVVPPARGIGVGAAHEHLRSNGTSVLALVSSLCAALSEAGVVWCHWKSNEALDRSASGENDLDLLFRRADHQTVAGVLDGLGFKEARPPHGREVPGVGHFYGLDVAGALVHVHAHFQLVMGDDTTKCFRLPVEDEYLASAVQGPVFRVPAPEHELVVFVVRMILKHSTWDAVLSAGGSLTASETRELAWLDQRCDADRLRTTAKQLLPFVGEQLWTDALTAVHGELSLPARLRVAGRLTRALTPFARRPPMADAALRIARRVGWATRRYVLRRRATKRLSGGGAVIAILGGDGSGKSTTVNGIAGWLRTAVATRQVHLGRPRPSATTRVLRGAARGSYRLLTVLRSGTWRVPATAPAASPAGSAPSVPELAWHLLTARDRSREHTRARRFAARGGVVVTDRFPVPQLRLMDGPRGRAVLDDPSAGRSARTLARLESRCYERMLLPDIVIVLRCEPELAVGRKVDEEPRYVRRRAEEVWAADWSGTRALVVDAGRPASDVLAEVRSLVWSRL